MSQKDKPAEAGFLNQAAVRLNESDQSVSLSVIDGHRIAIAEASFIPLSLAEEFLEDANDELSSELSDALSSCAGVLFFNRLNVPSQLRGRGLGSLLLDSMLSFCSERNLLILNSPNAYGDMSQDELVDFYERHGMVKASQDGLLVFSKRVCSKTGLSNPKRTKTI